eukprot:1553053-Pleurochrysis_carterae.AAC.3
MQKYPGIAICELSMRDCFTNNINVVAYIILYEQAIFVGQLEHGGNNLGWNWRSVQGHSLAVCRTTHAKCAIECDHWYRA